MISGILYGIASGSTVPTLGNPTLDYVVRLPRLVLVAVGGFFNSFGS